jgi:uncharacterized protein YjbI with pentapeptide repeats
MTSTELIDVVEAHGRWCTHLDGGNRADFSGMDLSGMNLKNMNLQYALFCGCKLVDIFFDGSDHNMHTFQMLISQMHGWKMHNVPMPNFHQCSDGENTLLQHTI